MIKKIGTMIFSGILCVNFCGCIAVMASMNESAKVRQNLNVPYGRALDIVKGALKTAGIKFESAAIRENIAEVRGGYSGDRTVRIFIARISDSESSVAVRIGTSESGKQDAQKILRAILDYADTFERN